MARKVIKEVASFDIETDKAVKSLNAYIDGLKKLEAQRKENIKLGKSTVAVNKQIDNSIDQINKSLKQTSTTTKGHVAQLEAVRKAQRDISKDGQKRLGLLNKEDKARKKITKSLRSQRRAFGELKFLAVGAAVGIVAALGQMGESIDEVNNVLFPSIGLQNKVAEATKGAVLEYVKEKAALDNKFDAVNAATVGTSEHKEAVKQITESYGPYLSDLAKEELALGNSTLAQKEATNAILKRIIAQTKLAIAEKLIQQIIDSRIDQANRSAQANAGVVQGIENVVGVLGDLFIPGGNAVASFTDLSEAAADAGNTLDQLKADSAAEQLNQLSKTGDDVFASFFKGFDGLAEIFEPFEEANTGATTSVEKTAKATKDLSGTIAGLNKQLQEAKKILTEGIQVTDLESLAEQEKIINEIEGRIKELQDFLKGVGQEAEIKPIIELVELDESRIEASLKKGLEQFSISGLKAKIESLEISGLINVEAIEDARNKALEVFRGTAEERDAINEKFNQQRLQREKQTAIAVVQLQLQILRKEREIANEAGESLTEFDKKIAQTNLKLTELEREDVTIKIEADTGDAEAKINKIKETIGFVVDGVEQLGGVLISFFQQQTDAALSKLEGDISRQESFLDELLSNQEGANAQQIALERDRLDNLVAEREKAVEKQAALAQLEIALNAAIAIAKAAAQGGAGAAITIAATLISMAIGFSQAKATAAQAFAGGSDYVTRAKGEPSGTDTINARLNEGEAVVQTDKNKTYHSAVMAIRRGSVDPELMHDFITDPDKYKQFAQQQTDTIFLPSLQRRMDMSGVSLNMAQGGNNGKQMDAMVDEMRMMREMMGVMQISEWKVKGTQFAKVVTSVQDKQKRHGKRFR